MESVFVNIKIQNNRSIIVGCIYRAPDIDINRFNNEMDVILDYTRCKNIFICGDFNINLLKYDSHLHSKEFVNILFCYGFYPLINTPTRV